jgi:hypothetical protein
MGASGVGEMPSIDAITTTMNAYLYPYYNNFKELASDYSVGVFILDARGIYTPIESGHWGIIHVERLPIVKPAVYGITDLTNCAVLNEEGRTIIFQGVTQVRTYGWRFIDESFQIKPISSFAPRTAKRLILMRSILERTARNPLDDDYEDDFQ